MPEFAEPTEEEQARINALRAQVAEMDLPEGVAIDFGIVDDVAEQIDSADAAVFLTAQGFTHYQPQGRPRPLPAIQVGEGLDWLEPHVAAGAVTCDLFGIGNELAGARVPLFAYFRLSIHDELSTPVYLTIEKAPRAWINEALVTGFVVIWPERPDGNCAWMATGPLSSGFVPPATPGRNERCPCGSGKKYKRCHGE